MVGVCTPLSLQLCGCYCSVMSNSLRPHGLHHARLLSFTIPQSLLKFMSIELVMPSNHCILYQPRLLLSSIFPSMDVFSKELVLHIERLFLNHEKTLGFLASGGEEFNPGPETRLDRSELFV